MKDVHVRHIYIYIYLLLFFFFVPDHYHKLASNYDRVTKFFHIPAVNLIKHYIPLSKTDQIIDLGGGTGEMIRLLRQDFGIDMPGVCVEPNLKMLQIAMKKDGIIPIHSTAEEFLAQMPKFPMKFVLICGAAHHFNDLAGVFANLAKYMPDDGICLLTYFPPPASIWFKAGLMKYKPFDIDQLYRILKSINLHCKSFQWKENVEMDKLFWYETLRSRFWSTLDEFSDVEIQEGICELEEKYGAITTLKYELEIDGCIITKQKEDMGASNRN